MGNRNQHLFRMCTAATLREVLFDPLAYAGGVQIVGTVAMIDLERKRLDVASDGAKLMVDIERCAESDLGHLIEQQRVTVSGLVKKIQRRTVLHAEQVTALSEHVQDGLSQAIEAMRVGEAADDNQAE